jgi:hypothetical protein
MKGLCTVSTGEVVNLLMSGDDMPELGKYYNLEDAIEGTGAQRRTREKLIKIYWRSGLHPKYGGDSLELFRDNLKKSLGEGFCKYVYADIVNGKPKIKEVKKESDIPDRIKTDPDFKEMILGKLKSCSHYTKKQNMKFIDNIILDMSANNVNSKEFEEIMKGLEK